MKAKKLSVLKRIFVLFCCTVLLSSSVFTSYRMTVYASETEWDDAAKAGIWIAAAIAGLLFVPEITASVVIGVLAEVGVNSVTIGKYIYENSDGTYTISEDFVQAVMDAAEQLEEQGFTDSDVKRQGEGYLETYKWTVTQSYMYYHPHTNAQESHHYTYVYSAENIGRVAGLKTVQTSTVYPTNRSVINHFWHVYKYDRNYTNLLLNGSGTYSGSVDGVKQSGTCSASFGSLSEYDGSEKSDTYNCSQSFGGNFPIFSNKDALKTYLKTGQGYKDAENYRAQPIFRRHSAYTPTYSGGSVTVNRTVVENITQKITEVDGDDSLTDDKKIEKLQEYIRTGGNTGVGGGGSGNTDYDDNKDLPAGTDLTDTNSWLKKIYLKVCQIFDKMSETAGNTMDSVVDSIKNLERMLNRYLSAITGDLDDIKGKLDQMTEEEFGEKTDSFLSETMDSFSEIGGVAKTKFPFSLPNDMRLLIERITVKPAETVSLHSDNTSHVTPYSGEHGGGGSTDGKPNPPGGGGASRPPGGIAYVEQGTAGECFTLSPTGAPLIRCPIVIKSRNIDFSIVIDLSEFDKVATLSRTFLTLLFVYGLLNLTFKVMGLWGDLVE